MVSYCILGWYEFNHGADKDEQEQKAIKEESLKLMLTVINVVFIIAGGRSL